VFIEAKDDGSGGDNWSYKPCKAPVKSLPPTNQHPVCSQAGCPSCHPTNSDKALEVKVWWRSMHAILSYCGNRPTNTHRQDRLQYTVPLSLSCSVITHLTHPSLCVQCVWILITLYTVGVLIWCCVCLMVGKGLVPFLWCCIPRFCFGRSRRGRCFSTPVWEWRIWNAGCSVILEEFWPI